MLLKEDFKNNEAFGGEIVMQKLISFDGRQVFVNKELLKEMCDKAELSFENLLINYTNDDVDQISKLLKLPFSSEDKLVLDSIEVVRATSNEIKLKEIELNRTNLYNDICDVLVFKREKAFIQALSDRGFEHKKNEIVPDCRGKMREVYFYKRVEDNCFVLIDNY